MTDNDPLQRPFNRHLGMVRAGKPGFVYALENHGDHPAALFALAEATSEAILHRSLADVSAVVRHVDAKFGEPLIGRATSRGCIDPDAETDAVTLLERQRHALVPIMVEIVDESRTIGLRATIEWHVQQPILSR